MARFIEYIKDGPEEVGRFGIMTQGKIIEVNEDEYQTAIRSDSFRKVGDDFDTSDCPPPSPTTIYDLTKFDWKAPRLCQRLMAKSRIELDKMGRAMEEITGQPLSTGGAVSTKFLADEMVKVAIDFGWNV